MKLWWLSFASETENLGVVITEAVDIVNAVRKCWLLGINPGGQVMSLEILPDSDEAKMPRDRLLSEKEIRAAGAEKIKEQTPEVQDRIQKCFEN